MTYFHPLLLALAVVLFVLAGLNWAPRGLSLGWWGLAFLTLAEWLH